MFIRNTTTNITGKKKEKHVERTCTIDVVMSLLGTSHSY